MSSGHSCPTHLEAASFASKTVSKLDDSSCLGVNSDPPLNPKCMAKLDLVEAQSKDKNIGDIIHLF